MKNRIFIVMLIATLLFSGNACVQKPQPEPEPEQPISSSDPTPVMEMPNEKDYDLGEKALVEEIEILFLESWPLQALAVVKGFVPDGCTEIYHSEAIRSEDTFHITLYTARPKDMMCTQALEEFVVNVPLDIYGLLASTYQVVAYEYSTSFTLEVDNILELPQG